LPARLAYPEIMPDEFHSRVLYRDQKELVQKLLQLIKDFAQLRAFRLRLSDAMGRFAWDNVINRYDEELEKLAR